MTEDNEVVDLMAALEESLQGARQLRVSRENTMKRYRSKPSEVDAIRWSGDNEAAIVEFMAGTGAIDFASEGEREHRLYLRAGKDGAQKWVPVPVGHWIVCQPNDPTDYWPVDGAYFDSKYEEA